MTMSWRCCGGSQEAKEPSDMLSDVFSDVFPDVFLGVYEFASEGVEAALFGCCGHDSRGQLWRRWYE